MTSPENLPTRPPETAGPPSSASGKISIDYIRDLFKLSRTAACKLSSGPDSLIPSRAPPHRYRWRASEVDEFTVTLRRERTRFFPTRLEPGSAGS